MGEVLTSGVRSSITIFVRAYSARLKATSVTKIDVPRVYSVVGDLSREGYSIACAKGAWLIGYFLNMKKRYAASPIVLIAIAAVWNVVFKVDTPIATAEDIQKITAPQATDSRHPIEVFQVGVGSGETENDVLAQLPTTIYPEDRVRFLIDPKFGLGTVVHIERALPLAIKDGKRVISVRTWDNTVSELLDSVNRELGNLDKANYKGSDALALNMTIEITRVAKVQITKKEVINFETVEKNDPNEYRGVTKVAEPGEKGERTKTYEIIREDGEEVSRKLIKDEVTKKPKNKVIVTGTKIKIGKTLRGFATWYCSDPELWNKGLSVPVKWSCPNPDELAASKVFPKGTVLRLTNTQNGRQVEVKIDDVGGNEVVDISPRLFEKLGGTMSGSKPSILAEEILNP